MSDFHEVQANPCHEAEARKQGELYGIPVVIDESFPPNMIQFVSPPKYDGATWTINTRVILL